MNTALLRSLLPMLLGLRGTSLKTWNNRRCGLESSYLLIWSVRFMNSCVFFCCWDTIGVEHIIFMISLRSPAGEDVLLDSMSINSYVAILSVHVWRIHIPIAIERYEWYVMNTYFVRTNPYTCIITMYDRISYLIVYMHRDLYHL